MDFFDTTGKMAIGSRLKMLTEKITTDAAQIYNLYGVELKPKWFPVFYTLSHGEPKTITSIAKEIGHSHPSVSVIIKEMSAKKIVKENKDKSDGRKNVILLTQKGKNIAEKSIGQLEDVATAVENISKETRCDLWEAIAEWEYLLAEKSLFDRVKEVKNEKEIRNIKIVSYEPQYRKIFRELNEEWISKYFEMEKADYIALDDPEKYIIQKGGEILIALYKNNPVGVCALLKMKDDNYDFEFAKLAVSPKAQGKNIGLLLSQAALKKAKELGAKKIYLESNTMLNPAINLYKKLGFKKVVGHETPYKRSNIQMELNL